MSEEFDCAVIGAGVVGLAIARRLALSGRSVIVVERNDRIGAETSSRNSEVIHAGLYYPAGSLKATLCVRGKALLYEYLQARGLPHARIGKLIVAVTEAERGRLDSIVASAAANGVTDLEHVDEAALAAREPAVRGVAALISPSTGIVDVHALMLSLQGDLETAGGTVALRAAVTGIDTASSGLLLDVDTGGERISLGAHAVINAAGLGAAALAGTLGRAAPDVRYAKGSYFTYQGTSPFRRLVYPLPVDGGLGIHATLDLAGRLRFGPDVEWTDRIDYQVDAGRSDAFAAAIRTYWPGLDPSRLAPGYAGIRPKLSGPGEQPADFLISSSEPATGGRIIDLLGIESPGLTSCLAIAEHVAKLVDGD